VDKAWHHLVRHLNEMPPREYSFLRARAQRLDAVHDRLFGLLLFRSQIRNVPLCS